MIQELIHKCLTEEHYASGIKALKLAGADYPSSLDRVLTRWHVSQDDFKRLRLYLLPLVDEVAQKEQKAAQTAKETPKRDVEPDAVRTLRVQGAKAYDEYDRLKTALREADSDESRYTIAQDIMQLTERIDDIYGRIRLWEEKGEIPFVLNDAAQQAVAMMKRMKTLESRISRLKKQTTTEAKQELAQKTAELQEIKNKLDL